MPSPIPHLKPSKHLTLYILDFFFLLSVAEVLLKFPVECGKVPTQYGMYCHIELQIIPNTKGQM